MPHGPCPWWMGYFLINPLRRFVQPPATILRPFLRPGMTAVDIGPGMGFFTLDAARLTAPDGRVIAVDLQEKMLRGLKRRAERAGLGGRVELRLCTAESLNLEDLRGLADFVLAYAVAHEVPDRRRFFAEIGATLKPNGRLLLGEPRLHVRRKAFDATVADAGNAGFAVLGEPWIRRSRTVLLGPARQDGSGS